MRLKVSEYIASKLAGSNKNDFRIQTFKGSGPGGQHRNKTETAVRITHKETGISVDATDSKSQARNKKECFRKLVLKLVNHYTMEEFGMRKEKVNRERIKTYNEQRKTVKDHRTGIVADYHSVLDGDIDLLIGGQDERN